jgi:hypothetical protein
MSRFDQLLERFKDHLVIPVRPGLPLTQRVWFLVYPPDDERRMINRIGEFEIATAGANLNWVRIDLSGAYADWMDTFDQEERDACLNDPEVVEEYANPGFRDYLCGRIQSACAAVDSLRVDKTVFVLTGLVELFDLIHVSTVLDNLDPGFRGILLVFFPGEREGNTYKFLGARTGWDYLAVPILAEG